MRRRCITPASSPPKESIQSQRHLILTKSHLADPPVCEFWLGCAPRVSLGQVEVRVTLPTVRRRELQYCCSDVPAFFALPCVALSCLGSQATYTHNWHPSLPGLPSHPILLQVFPFRSTAVRIIRLFSPRRMTSSHTTYPHSTLPFLHPVAIPCAGCLPPPVAAGQPIFSHIIPMLRPPPPLLLSSPHLTTYIVLLCSFGLT